MISHLLNIHDFSVHLNHGKFSISIANDSKSIDECLRLRHEVFATEMGAKLHNIEPGLDRDQFDEHCKHLMVIEKLTDRVVATTRLLFSSDINKTGQFYSETEFDISNIHDLQGSIIEIGRTCIHHQFRKGIVLSKLWQGIASIIAITKIDYLIGCASIPLSHGDQYLNSLMHYIYINHYSSSKQRVHPLVKLNTIKSIYSGDIIVPALLKGYLRHGAVICGEPFYDKDFGVADVFVFLDCNKLTGRYSKFFMDKISA